MKSLPLISIIIPTRQIGDYLINENFPAINKQTYKNFEVIVISNNKLITKYPWLHIIHIGKVTRPAEKRNIGAKKARGEILAFLDDDTFPDKNWLANAISLLKLKNIVAVCGPGILPEKTNVWEKIFDEILKSIIGSGQYNYRFIQKKQRYVDDYPSMNFFILKETFIKLGGFNNDYWPGEDSKLCEDLVYKEKGRILYDPNVLVYHHRRNNLLAFIKQHANYGFHRGAFFAHGDRNSRRLSYLIPTFFVLYLLIFVLWLLAVGYWQLVIGSWLLVSFPLILYLLILICLSIVSFISTNNLFIALVSPFVLFLTHLTYGIMFVQGLFTGILKKEKIY